jgi:hypothetical protein
MKTKVYTENQVRSMLSVLKDDAGGTRALAKQLGRSPSYVSDVLNGRRGPGPDFLKAVGIRKEVVVRYVGEGK